MLAGMISMPGAGSRADDDSVFVGRHRVLYIRRYVQKGPHRLGVEMLHAQRLAKAHLQNALNDGYSPVRAMCVKVMESRRYKRSVSERFARHVASSLQYCPLGSVPIDLLPRDGSCVPSLRRLGRFWSGPKGSRQN